MHCPTTHQVVVLSKNLLTHFNLGVHMGLFVLTILVGTVLFILFFVRKNYLAQHDKRNDFLLELLRTCHTEVGRIAAHGVTMCTNESFAQVQLLAPGFSGTFMWSVLLPKVGGNASHPQTIEGRMDLTLNRFLGLANHPLLCDVFVRTISFRIIGTTNEDTGYDQWGISLQLIATAKNGRQVLQETITEQAAISADNQYQYLFNTIFTILRTQTNRINPIHIA